MGPAPTLRRRTEPAPPNLTHPPVGLARPPLCPQGGQASRQAPGQARPRVGREQVPPRSPAPETFLPVARALASGCAPPSPAVLAPARCCRAAVPGEGRHLDSQPASRAWGRRGDRDGDPRRSVRGRTPPPAAGAQASVSTGPEGAGSWPAAGVPGGAKRGVAPGPPLQAPVPGTVLPRHPRCLKESLEKHRVYFTKMHSLRA